MGLDAIYTFVGLDALQQKISPLSWKRNGHTIKLKVVFSVSGLMSFGGTEMEKNWLVKIMSVWCMGWRVFCVSLDTTCNKHLLGSCKF